MTALFTDTGFKNVCLVALSLTQITKCKFMPRQNQTKQESPADARVMHDSSACMKALL